MSIALYRRFYQARKALPASGKAMPYDWKNLPDPLDGQWMAYSLMLDEFSRELANAINAFSKNSRDLSAWNQVCSDLSDKRRLDATHEFIDTLGTVALSTPYMIKSRFIFATAHLCHQANMAINSLWQDDLPLDTEIYIDAAESYAKNWSKFPKFKSCLDKINGKAFREATHDFRHSYNHRFSPRLLIGQTQFVTRYVDKSSKRVCYGFGGTPPLDLAEMSALLSEQRDRCYATFEAFQALVREQEAVISTQ